MPERTVEITRSYMAILRCRTWCQWPEWQMYKSSAYREPIPTASGTPIYLSLHIATYKDRARPEDKPACKLEDTAGPIVWRGNMDCGYWVGGAFIKAPDDVSKVEILYEPPYQGEIDLQLHMGTTRDVSIEELTPIAHAVCHSALTFVNLAAGEILIPVAPIQIRALTASGSQIETNMKLAVRARHLIEGVDAECYVQRFVDSRHQQSPEEAEALSVASRRLLSAISEMDSVDRYCDLWEVCEFATLFEYRPKGGLVGRIAQALSSHLQHYHPRLSKTRVEKALELRRLHRVRGRIIHEAVDSPHDLKASMHLLEEIASQLLKYKFDLPYTPVEAIDRRLETKPETRP